MKISEKPVNPEILAELEGFSRNVYVELEIPQASNTALVATIDNILHAWRQTGTQPIQDISQEDLVCAFGFTWGSAIIEQYGWQWAYLIFHDLNEWNALAAVSPDRSLMILPFAHIHECLARKNEVKLAASLSALSSDTVPVFAPKSYENLMHGLQQSIARA